MAAYKPPQTLEELYTEAQRDIATGGSIGLALKWAFKHARAAGRLATAEEARKRLAYIEMRRVEGMPTNIDAESEQIARAQLHDLETAKAIEVACANVMGLAERLPATPAARPKAA
jgi:hypothetical protein